VGTRPWPLAQASVVASSLIPVRTQMLDLFYYAILLLNVLWFGVAFHYFSVRRFAAAEMLVPESSRDSPLFLTIAASVRFLGGMNLAFATLSLLMLLGFLASSDAEQRTALLFVL